MKYQCLFSRKNKKNILNATSHSCPLILCSKYLTLTLEVLITSVEDDISIFFFVLFRLLFEKYKQSCLISYLCALKTWVFKLPFWVKERPHIEHTKGRNPECIRSCISKCDGLEKFLPHALQVYRNIFSCLNKRLSMSGGVNLSLPSCKCTSLRNSEKQRSSTWNYVFTLTLKVPSNCSRRHLFLFFFITIHMKYQDLFSLKNKKKYFKMSSAAVVIDEIQSNFNGLNILGTTEIYSRYG